MEGVKEGSRKHARNKTPTTPQYEDVTQESDLESVASSSASQSKRKRKFSWTLEQEEDLVGYINSYLSPFSGIPPESHMVIFKPAYL